MIKMQCKGVAFQTKGKKQINMAVVPKDTIYLNLIGQFKSQSFPARVSDYVIDI